MNTKEMNTMFRRLDLKKDWMDKLDKYLTIFLTDMDNIENINITVNESNISCDFVPKNSILHHSIDPTIDWGIEDMKMYDIEKNKMQEVQPLDGIMPL